MFKKLLDSVKEGFGHAAGSMLFDQAVKKVKDELREPTEEELRAEEERARKEAAAEARRAEEERKKAEEERRRAAKKEAAEIDAELAALKKKLGKK